MSEPQSVTTQVGGTSTGREAQARAAIARAAQATGVDFQYLMAQAKLESGLNPSAQASTSSAAGLFQFTNSTWLTMLDRHGANHGYGWAQGAIDGGKVSDPLMRSQIMSLRHDPETSAMMAAELALDNGAELQTVLGRKADSSELYLAHFLGSSGAKKFLTALNTNPDQSAAALFPQEAAANRSIFYDASGAKSLGEIMNWLRDRINAAMGTISEPGVNDYAPYTGFSTWASADGNGLPDEMSAALWRGGQGASAQVTPAVARGPIAAEFEAGKAEMAGRGSPSMAETLQSTFSTASGSSAVPDHVRLAYAKLARFGL